MICRGCGQLLGKHCFNEDDCIRISQSLEDYHYQQEDNSVLVDRIRHLEDLLSKNNIKFNKFRSDNHGYEGDSAYPQTHITWDEELGRYDDKPF